MVRKMEIILATVYLIVLLSIELFYLYFFLKMGLYKGMFDFPLIHLILVGVIVLGVSTWNYTVRVPFSKFLDSKVLGQEAILKMMALSFLMIAIYCFFLFLPLSLTSNDFLTLISAYTSNNSAENSTSQILVSLKSFATLTLIFKFVVTQASGLTALTLASLILRWRR